jgi:hypothetical protein
MLDDEMLRKIRSRIEQCRRLADYVLDPDTMAVLRQMASENEADLRKFETDRGNQDNDRRDG